MKICRKKREKCIIMAGYKFLLSIIISGIILNISVIFWIGKLYKLKCIIKIWLIIIGVNKSIKKDEKTIINII